MTTKAFRPDVVKANGHGGVEAIFSVFGNIDADGDVVDPRAFDHMYGIEVPMSSYNHGSWGAGASGLPIGKGVIRAEAGHAVFTASFFDTQAARDTREVLKGLGALGEWSFGLDVVEHEPGSVDGQRVRMLKRVDVFEVSPVLKGANPATQTLAVKTGGLTPADRAMLAQAQHRVDAWKAEQTRHAQADRAWLKTIAEANDIELRVAEICDRVQFQQGGKLYPVGEHDVRPATAAAAKHAADVYADRFAVRVPTLRWFRQPETTVWGATAPAGSAVLINAAADPAGAWVTVGHEIGHLKGMSEAQCRSLESLMEQEFHHVHRRR